MLPHSPPVPVAATFSASTLVLTVTFNRLLLGGTSAIGNWLATDTGFPVTRHTQLAPATILFNTVTAQLQVAGPGAPPPGFCMYNATPADVISRAGVPAAAFPQFPIVEIP